MRNALVMNIETRRIRFIECICRKFCTRSFNYKKHNPNTQKYTNTYNVKLPTKVLSVKFHITLSLLILFISLSLLICISKLSVESQIFRGYRFSNLTLSHVLVLLFLSIRASHLLFIFNLLILFFPMFPFDLPENTRKPLVFCFSGRIKGVH